MAITCAEDQQVITFGERGFDLEVTIVPSTRTESKAPSELPVRDRMSW